ncbi:hypothetical protein D9611_003807 [Ephemerocybe angulata]|uniref:Uncharacterized protein n=1 Tax=Ephemerocybe angulata TaxID=980116 RepID=A0A8H5B658_9AGAR|nr:hypothetical protein D9611_003807 [Tulosesus angulatus]
MATKTIATTSTRRRRRSGVGHEAQSPHRGGSMLGTLQTLHDFADTTAASHRHFYSPFSGSAQYLRPSFSLESGWVDGLDGKASVYTLARSNVLDEVDHDDDEQQQYDDDDNNRYAHNNHEDDQYDNNELYNDDDDDEDLYYEKLNDMRNANTRLPRISTESGALSGIRRNTFGIPINNPPLSPPTTPPPPRQPPCPPAQNKSPPRRSRTADAPTPPVKHLASPSTMPVATKTRAPPHPPQPQSQSQPQPGTPKLDTPTEIALLQDNFNLLRTVLEDLQIMCTWFFAQRPVEAFTDHVDTCGAIEDSVNLILENLTRRRRLGEEEWNVRSPGWHSKYCKRMYSLNRTLFRLLSIRPTIEERVLKPHQIANVLKKLREHQDKMGDLATKFQASFDRLRLRHIHFLLTKAYSEAHERDASRRLDESSFEQQWYEDKAVRADLRREFFAAKRTRQATAP